MSGTLRPKAGPYARRSEREAVPGEGQAPVVTAPEIEEIPVWQKDRVVKIHIETYTGRYIAGRRETYIDRYYRMCSEMEKEIARQRKEEKGCRS